MAPAQEFGPSQSDFARLDERVGQLEASIGVVASGHAVLHDQISELTVTVHMQDTQLRAALEENSKVTRETLAAAKAIQDVVTTARTGSKFVRALAPTLLSAAVIWGIFTGWLGAVGDFIIGTVSQAAKK